MAEAHPIDLAAMKARLEEQREEVRALLEASAESGRTVELDQTRVGRLSRMDAMQSQAMAAETERRRGHELRRIEAALKRIAEEEFGYCLSCGEDIPRKRLELDPTTPICVDCASVAGG